MTATMQARSIINTVSFLPEKNRKNTVRLQPTKGSENSWHEINMMWTKSWKIQFDLNQLKRLLAYLIPYRKRFVSVGFMMLSASAFTMLIPQFFQKVMDVCIPNKDMKGIAFYSFLTLLAAFYSAFSLRYKIEYTNQIGQQIIHDMRYDIFEHLQELPFSYYDDRPHGKIQVRVVNYVNSISDLLSNGILNTITDLCNLVFIIVFMLIYKCPADACMSLRSSNPRDRYRCHQEKTAYRMAGSKQ